MQHRQSGYPDPDESPGHDPGGWSGGGDPFGGRAGDTRAFSVEGAAGPSLGARLRAERGSVDVIDVALDRQVLVIGRRLTNDIVIHDTNVSRQHARLLRGPNGYSIEDTQSSNGTFVNDERVFGPRPLRDGDEIRIGDAVFVYEAAAPIAEPADPSAGPMEWTRAIPDPAAVAPAEPDVELPVAPDPLGPSHAGPDRVEYAAEPAGLSADELEDELERRDADDAAAVRVGAVAADVPQAVDGASATGTALVDVGRDLDALAQTAARLADRVRMLEGALDTRPRRAPEPGGPSSDDTVALVEFSRLLRDLQTFGDPEAATAAANLLDDLSRQPRDVELLLSISRQAPIMAVVLRQHAYLMRLAPLLDEALGRMLQ